QASVLLNPNNGGRKLFGYSDADLTTGMIQMSRVGLTSRTVDRMQIICNRNKRLSTSPGIRQNVTGDGGQRGGGGGGAGTSGAAGSGEDRHGPAGGPMGGARQGAQTAPGGSGSGPGSTKHGRSAPGGVAMTDDGEGGEGTEENRGGGGWGDGREGSGHHDGVIEDNDHSQILKIKAAQALFRMSLEPGGEVLAFLVNGVKTRDPTTLSNVAIALCRCTYEARNHESLVTEFNAAQALCYIMQRHTANLKIIGAKGMLNLCGLSSTLPSLAAKLDVYMLTLCSAMEDLARNESEAVQVKLNLKRPGNLAYLASASVNLADLKSAHAQLVKQKDIVTVLCLLSEQPKLVENVSRAHPVSESSVTSWLALEADSASPDGRLACLSAIEHLIRNQEEVDTPLLRAGLMGTLHAILDEPIAAAEKATEQAQEAGILEASASSLLSSASGTAIAAAGTATTHGSVVTPLIDSPSDSTSAIDKSGAERPSSLRSGVAGTGGGGRGVEALDAKKIVAMTQTSKKNRERLLRSSPDVLDRILAVVTKTCFSMTLRGRNRPRLVQHGLPALCGKVMKASTIMMLTKDENIKFMAAACIFSLAQSVDLCSDIAESGAADLALEDLANGGQPGQNGQEESEFLLAQLAIVAQVAVEPRFCRRMASAKMIDLLMTLALGDAPDKKTEHERPRPDAEGTNDGSGRSGGSGAPNTSGREGSGRGNTVIDGGGEKGGVISDGFGSPRPQRPGWPMKGKRFSGERVKVATPYVGALRYCVVAIVERVGTILNADGEYERASSPSEIASMVKKLVYLVCSAVLTSGPDEALMGRCARVMADWSSEAKFAKEMGIKEAAGKSLAVLMRSVSPKTKACTSHVSVALCNVAAAVQCEAQLPSPRNDGSAARPVPAITQDEAAVNEAGVGGHGKDTNDHGSQRQSDGGSSTQSLRSREPDNNHVVSHEGSGAAVSETIDSNEGSVAAGNGDRLWLTNTNILRDTIAGCLASATADVKSNLIKAMNNLMVSRERRATLVAGDEMSTLFELVHGYTPEVRELVARMLWNLTCEHDFHSALLEAGVTCTLLELLGSSSINNAKKANNQQQEQQPDSNAAASVRGVGNSSGDGGGVGATDASVSGTQPGAALLNDGGVGPVSGGETESAQDGSSGDVGPATSGAIGVGRGPEASTATSARNGHTVDAVGEGSTRRSSSSTGERVASARLQAVEAVSMGRKPSLEVRRNVLGAVMNLTSLSISNPRLDPSAVMSLLTLIMHEDPNESPNEDMVADLWVTWQAVVLRLSFVEKYRALIVYHGDGQIFSHLKLTNDPLSGKSSVMSMAHDRAYKRLIMGTMVNISCETSLCEELEGQVQVLREFLSEYEHEASGGAHSTGGTLGGARGGSRGGSKGGSRGGMSLADGDGLESADSDERGLDQDGGGMGGGGGGSGGGSSSSRGRDWVRHELCAKLVSNLFSSKTLRERLSKKPIAGILVGLLCGPPTRWNNRTSNSGGSSSGCGEPRPLLYGGGEEAAAITSRFLCDLCILFSTEGGFDLPQRTFDALVKIAHYYNYNASSTPAAAASTQSHHWRIGEGGGSGGEVGGGVAASASVGEKQPQGMDGNTSPKAARKDSKDSGAVMSEGGLASTDNLADSLSMSPPTGTAGHEENQRSPSSPGRAHGSKRSSLEATAAPAPTEEEAAGGGGGGSSPRLSEGGGDGSGGDMTQQTKASRKTRQESVGDDWYTEGAVRPHNQAYRHGNNKQGVEGGGGEDAWSRTAREITRMWVRAVGWLCSPSHSNLWPHMIEVGILGAINTCVSSSTLSGDEEGLAICSAALRNLSTATSARSLGGERAAACFGTAKRLLSCCSDQPQVQVNCAAAMVNLVDATHVQDLQTLDVVGLLGENCSWEDHGDNTPCATTVGELAIYSLSKLCSRDFLPKGDRVIATITTMMDFEPQTIKRLDDSVRSLVDPPLPPRGPWHFLHPNDALGLTALPVLTKGAHKKSAEVVDQGQPSAQRSPENTHDAMNGQHQGLQLGDTSATMISTSGAGEVGGEETADKSNNTSSAGNKGTTGGGSGGLEREAMASLPAADLSDVSSKSANESAAAGVAAKGAGGDGNSRKGRGDGRTLKNTAARLATVISETSM
ncbi:unnamed protein product, partial [Ectocarpus sp. 13 AM-2016]